MITLPSSNSTSSRTLVVGFVLITLMYLAVASMTSLWDRDEPRFARAAVEMVQSGDYIVPTFNGNLRPDKPAMIYWLMSVPIQILGPITIAVRLPSICGLLLACLITYRIGKRMFDDEIGRDAAIMLGTSLMATYIGTASTADGVLLACITLGIWTFIESLYSKWTWRNTVVLSVAFGAAQLTKGPVGLAIPLMMIVGTCWLGRKAFQRPAKLWLWVTIAVIAGTGMFLAWGYPANEATDGRFLQLGIGHHVINRMAEAQESHGGKGILGYVAMIPFYIPAIAAGFFPWSLHVGAAVSAMLRKTIGDDKQRAILIGWIAPTFILMSLVATKLPHYVLPIYPALAIASAATVRAKLKDQLCEKDRDWLRGGIWLFGITAAVFVVLIVGGAWMIHTTTFVIGLVIAAVIAGIAWKVCRAQLSEDVVAGTNLVARAIPVMMIVAAFVLLPSVEQHVKISPQLADEIRDHVEADVPVYTYGYDEPSLIFYLNRSVGDPVQSITGGSPGIDKWARDTASGDAVGVITQRKWEQVQGKFKTPDLQLLATRSAVNYSASGRRQHVLILLRKGDQSPQ